MRKIIVMLAVVIFFSVIASNGFGASITRDSSSSVSGGSSGGSSPSSGESGKGPLTGNQPPVAEIVSITPNPGFVDQEVNFVGRGYDPENGTKYFSWDFNGDSIWDITSAPVSGNGWVTHSATYNYNYAGEYIVTLRVMDVVGDFDTKTKIENVKELCDLSIQATYSPDPIQQGDYIYFNVVISDQLGNYNGQVQVLTTSNIPIDLTNYFNWNTEGNSASGSISFIWPNNENSYYVEILVVPQGAFFDMDVSDNMITFENLVGEPDSVELSSSSSVFVQSQSLTFRTLNKYTICTRGSFGVDESENTVSLGASAVYLDSTDLSLSSNRVSVESQQSLTFRTVLNQYPIYYLLRNSFTYKF